MDVCYIYLLRLRIEQLQIPKCLSQNQSGLVKDYSRISSFKINLCSERNSIPFHLSVKSFPEISNDAKIETNSLFKNSCDPKKIMELKNIKYLKPCDD